MVKKAFEYVRTAADDAKASDRRARREQQLEQEARLLRRERARAAVILLENVGCLGVVALKGASVDYFLDGLEDTVGADKVLRLDTYGKVQGVDLGPEEGQRYYRMMRNLYEEHSSSGILAFLGFNFADNESTGTPIIANYVRSIMERQAREKGRSPGQGILLIGDGQASDLITHDSFKQSEQHPLGQLLTVHLALGANRELSTAPEYDFRFTMPPKTDPDSLKASGLL